VRVAAAIHDVGVVLPFALPSALCPLPSALSALCPLPVLLYCCAAAGVLLYCDMCDRVARCCRRNLRASNKGWRIDYFLLSTAFADKVADCAVRAAVTGSDHCPIVLDLDV
jgi:hypothetical protein